MGSQAWEWGHFIHGDKGAIDTKTEYVVHIAKGEKLSSVYELMDLDKYSYDQDKEIQVESVINQLKQKPDYNIRTANKTYLSNEESIKYLKENATQTLLGADCS